MDNDILVERLINIKKCTKKLMDKKLEKLCSKYKLSMQEMFILFFLTKDGDLKNASCIVKKHGFSKAYVSKLLSLLSSKGYIELKNDNNDKRYQDIKLLKKAEKLTIEFENIHKDNDKILKYNIDDNEYKIFLKVIDKIIDNAKNYKEEI